MVSLSSHHLTYSIILSSILITTSITLTINTTLSLPSWVQANNLSCKLASSKLIPIMDNCSAQLALCEDSSKAYLKVHTNVNGISEQNVIVQINIPQECILLTQQTSHTSNSNQEQWTVWISQGVCDTPTVLETKCTVDTDKLHLEVTGERKDNKKISQGFALALFIISICILVAETGFILHKLCTKDRVVEDQRRSALEQFVSQQSQSHASRQ